MSCDDNDVLYDALTVDEVVDSLDYAMNSAINEGLISFEVANKLMQKSAEYAKTAVQQRLENQPKDNS